MFLNIGAVEGTYPQSVLDETISEAVAIVDDTDKWTVEINSSLSQEKSPQPVVASHLVCNLIEAVLQLWKLKMSPEFICRKESFVQYKSFIPMILPKYCFYGHHTTRR